MLSLREGGSAWQPGLAGALGSSSPRQAHHPPWHRLPSVQVDMRKILKTTKNLPVQVLGLPPNHPRHASPHTLGCSQVILPSAVTMMVD